MFQIGNVRGIIKYVLICALTLSSECQAAVNKDDNTHYFTTRRSNEQFTVPTYPPQFSVSATDYEDRAIFFVVLTLSVVFIGLLSYLCHRSKASSDSSSSSSGTGGYRVPGAVVHPPPSHLTPSTTIPTAPTSTHNPMMVSFVNTGYQNDSAVDASRPRDVPPNYSAVAMGDLTNPHQSQYPSVIQKKMDSPPPKYIDGHQFSP